MPPLRASQAVIAAALLAYVPALASPPAVDRIFTARGDVTGAGRADLLTIHITGTSIQAPLRWTASITDPSGHSIFQFQQDDAAIDQFFHDAGFERNCSGYVSCKERYYFHDLPAAFFAALTPAPAAWAMDRYFTADLTNTVTQYLNQRDQPKANICLIIHEIENILHKPGYHVVDLLTSPVAQTPPMLWVPSAQQFIPFYQE